MPKLSEDTPLIHEDCSITESTMGRFVEIGKGSRVAYSVIGDYSYCDRYADIANAEVGKFANIASFARIGATDHPLHTASLHHFLYRSSDYWDDVTHDPSFFDRRRSRIARIGHDTWIGHNAQIKPAVVTKDVDPYTIVAGMPAKIIRRRQPVEISERLQALAWWDWSHERLRETLEDFRALPAEEFLERYEG